MFTYKQRYKPRTTREYTKSDLTVYDSAGNTALNALTVYGKSEVVNGEIVSAGDSGSIEIETCGKNLLNPTKYYQRSGYTNIVANYTNNVIQVENITSAGRFIAWNIKTTPGEQVTISWTNANNVISFGIINTETFVNNWVGYGYSIDSGRTITSSTEWLQVYADLQVTEQATASIAELQVEKGTSATAYEPYNGTMAVFETGTPLYGIDENTRDIMTWDGSAGEVTKMCGEENLGSFDYVRREYQGVYYFRSDNIKTTVKSVADAQIANIYMASYEAVSANDLIRTAPNHTVAVDIQGYLYIRADEINNVTDFKTAMSGVMLIYELATPTTEPLTQTENESIASLRTFDGTTHFTNNATTDMTVNYTIKVPTIS